MKTGWCVVPQAAHEQFPTGCTVEWRPQGVQWRPLGVMMANDSLSCSASFSVTLGTSGRASIELIPCVEPIHQDKTIIGPRTQ